VVNSYHNFPVQWLVCFSKIEKLSILAQGVPVAENKDYVNSNSANGDAIRVKMVLPNDLNT
jgi:hypothetical protein